MPLKPGVNARFGIMTAWKNTPGPVNIAGGISSTSRVAPSGCVSAKSAGGAEWCRRNSPRCRGCVPGGQFLRTAADALDAVPALVRLWPLEPWLVVALAARYLRRMLAIVTIERTEPLQDGERAEDGAHGRAVERIERNAIDEPGGIGALQFERSQQLLDRIGVGALDGDGDRLAGDAPELDTVGFQGRPHPGVVVTFHFPEMGKLLDRRPLLFAFGIDGDATGVLCAERASGAHERRSF